MQVGLVASNHEIWSAAAVAPAAKAACSKMLPGAAFACCNIFVGYPFDTVKTRLQLQLHPSSKHCLQELSRQGPLAFKTALYRGASLPLCALVLKQPFEFAAFEYCARAGAGSYCGGLLAGSVGALIACPFNMAKIWMQSQSTRSGSSASVFQSLARLSPASSGFAALPAMRQAVKASIAFQVPYTTSFLGTYGTLREALGTSTASTAFSGATAALFTWAVVLPLDVLRTRVQAKAMAAVESHGTVPRSLATELMAVVRSNGVKGLWAGWGPISLRAITASVSMTAYESLKT
ncbi:unnamed protein product [Effrenium voratum]|nr:unnamed protein product [Effrenium voratum]